MNRAIVAFLSILCLASVARARGVRKTVPFPVSKSTILRDDQVIYTVEGRQRIPRGVEISCQKDVKIIGKGPGAVIEVQGALRVHGVTDREVIFEGLTIEPAPAFLDIHLDMVWFRKGAGIRTPEGTSVSGKLFIENVAFQLDAWCDVTFNHGHIDLSSVNSDIPIHISAVPPEGSARNKVKLKVRGCTEDLMGNIGLKGGLIVTGVDDATIRINRLGGALSRFSAVRMLEFDGNKVDSQRLEFHQPEMGDFRKTEVTKCDLYCEVVAAESVGNEEKTRDRILAKGCWFRGVRRTAEIREKFIRDGADDPKNAALIVAQKPGKRPLELAGPWTR